MGAFDRGSIFHRGDDLDPDNRIVLLNISPPDQPGKDPLGYIVPILTIPAWWQ